MSVVSVYVVFADADEAQRIGSAMVEELRAACVNVLGPVRSIYRWKDGVETAEEVAAIFKTTKAQADGLVSCIAALHSYEVPCIVAWPIDNILGTYADWVEKSVG